MAWAKRNTKGAPGDVEVKAIPVGAPVAVQPGVAGKPYHDGWDIERAYHAGKGVVWVMRSIDAIAGNQAKLPIVLRKTPMPDGAAVKNDPLTEILNVFSNEAEDAFIFRYRLSAQLLLSTRGVFVEVIRGFDGRVTALHLLPPGSTAPIPHPKRFVAGYEVKLGPWEKKVLKPQSVVWVRRPHPLDPYKSLTPMESAGIAIETETLAKLYNRNFMINDGRPGGLLVMQGEMDEDDKQELQNRFRGNISKTGQVSVVSSDDGATFIDTAANPRDAAYIETRKIIKEEILAAFGVPESVIGNASGRTFSNAAEEGKVFWMETMEPHLMLISRAFAGLSDNYPTFDTSGVPILIIAKQERDQYALNEFGGGLITANEYREQTGREKVESDLADSMLANPNLTPIGNTERPMEIPDQNAQGGAPPGAPLDVQNGSVPVAGEGGVPAFDEPPAEQGVEELSYPEGIETKRFGDPGEWDEKSAQEVERWEVLVEAALDRFFDRQHRVVLEKAGGKKMRKALAEGKADVDDVFDIEVWNRQLAEDLRPVFAGAVADAATRVATKDEVDLGDSEDVDKTLDAQVEQVQKINETTKDEVGGALLVAAALTDDEGNPASLDDKLSMFKVAIFAVYQNAQGDRKQRIAGDQAQAAYNAGLYFAGLQSGTSEKRWVSRKDSRVRQHHRLLDGKVVPIDEGFSVDGATLRFPHDPLAPPHLTIGCRCGLAFS